MTALNSFADLIAPLPEDEFFAGFHDRQPVHVPAADSRRFAEVMSWDALNQLLNQSAIWSSESLQLVLDRRPVPPSSFCRSTLDRRHSPTLQPDADKVTALLRQGATLVANDIDTLNPGLARTAAILEQTLGGNAQINLYCSWQERQAFDTHYDPHEVFALHIEGEKRWRIYEGRVDHPVSLPGFQSADAADTERDKGRVLMEVTMRPGDLLYIPRGTYHDALAATSATIHVTCGVDHVIGFDLLKILMKHAMADPLFRTDFPLPARGEAATRRQAEALADRLGDIARSDAFGQDLLQYRRDYPNRRGGFALPEAVQSDAYLVQADGWSVIKRDDRYLVEGPTGTLVIPSRAADVVAWILARPRFELAELEAQFPNVATAHHGRMLANLSKAQIIVPRAIPK